MLKISKIFVQNIAHIFLSLYFLMIAYIPAAESNEKMWIWLALNGNFMISIHTCIQAILLNTTTPLTKAKSQLPSPFCIGNSFVVFFFTGIRNKKRKSFVNIISLSVALDIHWPLYALHWFLVFISFSFSFTFTFLSVAFMNARKIVFPGLFFLFVFSVRSLVRLSAWFTA